MLLLAYQIHGKWTLKPMLLRLAQVHQKRGRKDKIEPLRGEWKLLEDWERPFSKDFDDALEEFNR